MSKSLKKTITVSIISLPILALYYYVYTRHDLLTPLENLAIYYRVEEGRKTPVNQDLILVGIDQPDYANIFQGPFLEQAEPDDRYFMQLMQGSYPWTREVWAHVVERLMQAGAKGVIIDIVFAAERDEDGELKAVLDKYSPNVIIGAGVEETDENVSFIPPSGTIIEPDEWGDTMLDPRVGLTTIQKADDTRVHRGNFILTQNDFFGRFGSTSIEGDRYRMKSLSARAIDAMGLSENLPDVSVRPIIRYTGSAGTFLHVSLYRIIDPREWSEGERAAKNLFKDKWVLIGPTAGLFHDEHATPWMENSIMKGPEIHLNILNAAIHKQFIHDTSDEADAAILALTVLLAYVLAIFVRGSIVRLIVGLILSGGYGWFVFYSFNHLNLMIDPAFTPILMMNSSNVAILAYDWLVEKWERTKLTLTMNKYFSPAVMKEVLDNPGSLDSKAATVTLLLTDLRNSTPLAEKLGPKGMFKLLNQIFEAQTDAIMSEDGQLEHFLGDQFLSYWGAPNAQPDGPNQSLRAARELIVRMEKVKAIQEPEVKAIFGYGVALHCGFALVGNKGSEKKMEYGLVGDTINEAARIEALTKYYGAQLLVSQEIFTQLTQPGRHRLIDRVIVKGKSEPVVLYELEQMHSPPNFDDIIADFNSAFADYSDGKFEEAKAKFQKLIDEENDGPSKAMLARCEQLIAEPDPDWKGVWKMESK